jgi:hypothetical protein
MESEKKDSIKMCTNKNADSWKKRKLFHNHKQNKKWLLYLVLKSFSRDTGA